MHVLDPTAGDRLPDDRRPEVRWALPTTLAPAVDRDGVPEVLLTRSAHGGALRLRLRAGRPAPVDGGGARPDPNELPCPWSHARFRLVLAAETTPEHGTWRNGAPPGDVVVDTAAALDPHEVAIVRRLAQQGGPSIDVEVELAVRGPTPSWPWLGRVDLAAVRDRLRAASGDAVLDRARAIAQLAALPPDLARWIPLRPGSPMPPAAQLWRELAHRLIDRVCEPTEGGLRAAAAARGFHDESLAVPRIGERLVPLRWSLSDFIATRPDPSLHLPQLVEPAPLEGATMYIAHDLSLDAGAMRELRVEVATGGPTGRVSHTFAPGSPSVARVAFVRETFEPLALRWRARAVISTSAGAAEVATDFVAVAEPVVRIDAAALGLQAVRVAAEARAFDAAAQLEVAIGRGKLILSRERPEAWLFGRARPSTAALTAIAADGRRVALGERPVDDRGVWIDAALLGVDGWATVTVTRDPAAEPRLAYVAVQREGEGWRTLERGEALRWRVARASALAEPAWRHRVCRVVRDEAGKTRPMETTGWLDGRGERLAIGAS